MVATVSVVELIRDLTASLPRGSVITDPDVLESVRRDQAPTPRCGRPSALIRPRSTEDVQKTMRVANRLRVPVVPRGAGSGLSGGANAVDDGIVLDTTGMRDIVEIDCAGLIAVVQPGVLNAELSTAAEEVGLWYAPDPASYRFSTIGGNIATNAGGLCCIKYGSTGRFVLALEVVLADGRLLRTGSRSHKSVAGYDLTGLFVGSEGTLGIITQATMRLLPRRPASGTVVAFFPSVESAAAAVVAVRSRLTPALAELMDQVTVRAIEAWKPMELDTRAEALLILGSDAPHDQLRADLSQFEDHCKVAGASFIARSTDEIESELLREARRLAYPALERLGTVMLDDVAVPLDQLAPMVRSIRRIAERFGVVVGTFGHAGDGNLHPTIVFDGTDPTNVKMAMSAFDAIVDAALQHRGTVTGEHGVGALKVKHLRREVGATGIDVHRAIKCALDPTEVLNPGKVLSRQVVWSYGDDG